MTYSNSAFFVRLTRIGFIWDLCDQSIMLWSRFFISNAGLGGRRMELKQTLSHVSKWARFENGRL